MRPRVVAVSTATLIAAASLSPVTAQAAGQNTLYVNSGSSACTDSGSGTFDMPYCSIQAAADAANPGDVVLISSGIYTAATITRSGTASAPIVFTGGPRTAIVNSSTTSSELTISGASDIEIEHLSIRAATGTAVTVDGGSANVIANDSLGTSVYTDEVQLHVTGGATDTTVRGTNVFDQFLVDDGASGTVITTNEIGGDLSNPLTLRSAVNTAITSNTIGAADSGISVSSSPGTSIENNVVDAAMYVATASTVYGVQVDTSSAAGTTLDYNDVYAGSGVSYSWSGTPYATAAALYAAVKQGQHDYNGSDGMDIAERSPIINSANSAAIGEQAVDFNGDSRTLDPLVAPTGAGPYHDYDRGAIQFQDPYIATANSSLTVSQTKIPLGASVTAHAALADTWGDVFTSYMFGLGSSTVTSSTPTAALTPTATGSDPTTVEVESAGSSAYTFLNGVDAVTVQVVTPQPLVAQESLTASGSLGVLATDAGTTGAWNISTATFDFGDNTPEQTVADGEQAQHTYAKAGTYTVTETVKDVDGNTATTSSAFTTNDPVADTLVSLDSVSDVPAGSTGIAQAAFAGAIAYGRQLLAVTTSGTVEFASTDPNNSMAWQSWQKLSLPAGVTARWVGIAGMPNGSSQLIVVSSTGELWHTVRNANGTFQVSGWGSPAGSTGFTRASITAMPDGSSQLVAVTTGGVLMHNIRFANGSWQGWRPLSQPGVKVIDGSIAGMPDGSSQIVEVTSAGVLKHNIRFANGKWQVSGWGSPVGSTGITQASIANVNGVSEIAVVESNGNAESDIRSPNGSWNGWTKSNIPPVARVANVSISTVPDWTQMIYGVSAG